MFDEFAFCHAMKELRQPGLPPGCFRLLAQPKTLGTSESIRCLRDALAGFGSTGCSEPFKRASKLSGRIFQYGRVDVLELNALSLPSSINRRIFKSDQPVCF